MSILLYGYTTWMLTKHIEKKLDGNSKRMLWAIMNKSWKQHLIKQQLHGHLPPISKTIQIRQTRHVGHCKRSKDELISDILLWTPSYKHAGVGWPTRTYLHLLCTDTRCSLEDLPEDGMIETNSSRVREIHAISMIWWWFITILYHIETLTKNKISIPLELSIFGFTFNIL